jgi:hypothetical protein
MRLRFDRDDAEKAALVELPKATIERDRFPLSPKAKTLRTILAKLDPPAPRLGPMPPPKPSGNADRRGVIGVGLERIFWSRRTLL